MPTGVIVSVAQQPLDFRVPTPVGARIGLLMDQPAHGLRPQPRPRRARTKGEPRPAARLHDPITGRSHGTLGHRARAPAVLGADAARLIGKHGATIRTVRRASPWSPGLPERRQRADVPVRDRRAGGSLPAAVGLPVLRRMTRARRSAASSRGAAADHTLESLLDGCTRVHTLACRTTRPSPRMAVGARESDEGPRRPRGLVRHRQPSALRRRRAPYGRRPRDRDRSRARRGGLDPRPDRLPMPVVATTEAIREVLLAATAAPACIGVIAWMHTFSPAGCGSRVSSPSRSRCSTSTLSTTAISHGRRSTWTS